jgi:hypothetical protein
VFQYLLTADGNVRDRKAEPAETRHCASSRSRQSKVWRNSGNDFEALVVKLFGRSLKRPLTTFHGAKSRHDTHFIVQQCSAELCRLSLQLSKSIFSKCSWSSTSLLGCCMQH